MLITDWIRAAVSGETVDGREITATQIEQMATSYSPDVYLSKIWLEHLRAALPDNVFKPLGDVFAVKAEEIKRGDLAGRSALYVKLAPSDELIRLVRSGQKTHLSIEMHPSFPHTGGAYLMGLGVTDSPASVGTGIMSFNAGNRKENLFSTPVLCDLSGDLPALGAQGSELSEILELLRSMKKVSGGSSGLSEFVSVQKFNDLSNEFNQLKREFTDYMNQEEPQPKPPEHGTVNNQDIWNY